MLNKLPVKPGVVIPRALVIINGVVCRFTHITVEEKNFYEADVFNVSLPLDGMTPDRNLQYFATEPGMVIEIYAGYPSNPSAYGKADLKSIFTGQIDDCGIDFESRSIDLIGRDFTALFIDNKTTNKFQNLTASQIVTKITKARGLIPVVTETKTKATNFYGQDFTKMTSQQSEWDLMCDLARAEDFVIYIKGREVHFKPRPSETDDPYGIQYNIHTGNYETPSLNAVSLRVGRALTIARDVIVELRSNNAQKPHGFTVRYKLSPTKKTVLKQMAQPIGDAQVYVERINGLSREQALQKAQQIAREISQHQKRLDVTMSPDYKITKNTALKLQGTQSDFDQVYFPAEIKYTITPDDHRVEIAAKNHSTNSEVIL